ncbi:MAG: SDR family NAD(P)-dependent oxidoreductase [Candidatus Micrarchaeia archaeon]
MVSGQRVIIVNRIKKHIGRWVKLRLSNKNAIITGGAGSIGSAVAERFLEEGANVFIFDNDEKSLNSTIEKLKGKTKNLSGSLGDVTSEDSVKGMVEDALKFFKNGRIDILANIAGISPFAKFTELTVKDFDRTINVNLKGTFLVSKLVVENMIKNGGGVIINMSSTNGLLAEEGLAAYNASKAGVILLSKTMALELAKYNIRVNSVCPGWIQTELQYKSGLPKAMIDNYVSKIPLGRAGTPNDVANLFVFLASDESAFITGTEIVIDGGQICQE